MNYLIVFLVSMLPIIELRGAIPIGLKLGLEPLETFLLSLFGNVLIIPILLIGLDFFLKLFKRIDFFKKIIDKIEIRAKGKYEKLLKKYGLFALVVFVAIPLPGSGAWSGALVSKLMFIDNKKAFFLISLGVLIASIIVLVFSNIIIINWRIL